MFLAAHRIQMQHFLPFQYCFCFRQLSEIFGSFALKCSTAIANELLTLELDHCYNLTCLERLKMKRNDDLKKKQLAAMFVAMLAQKGMQVSSARYQSSPLLLLMRAEFQFSVF